MQGEGLLAALATPPAEQSAVLPHASSYGLEAQLGLLRADLEANPHEDSAALLSELNEAQVALRGLQALETRALAPASPQFPQPLPMSVLNIRSQDLAQKLVLYSWPASGIMRCPSRMDCWITILVR